MTSMFNSAKSFNGDILDWDVSKVVNMNYMFWQATSFNRQLCRVAWVKSKASQIEMFTGSAGTVCRIIIGSRSTLRKALVECLRLTPNGNWPNGPHGPVSEWDISGVIDMHKIFHNAKSFNGDVSKWFVSRVTTMNAMFAGATLFNADISKWDVSSVEDMSNMFSLASSFLSLIHI